MKKIMMVMAAMVAVVLTGCNMVGGKLADLKGEWNIYEANGFSIENPEALLSINPETGVVYGWLGCNVYHSTFDLDEGPGEIEFEAGTTTLMSCDRIEQEQAISAALERVERFKLSKDKQELTLYGDDNVVALRLRRVSDELPDLGKYSTATPLTDEVNVATLVASSEEGDYSIQGTWQLVKLPGLELDPERAAVPFIEVDLAKKAVSGNLACNTFNARLEVEKDDEIDIDDIVTTRATCDQIEVEGAFAKALDEADRFAFEPSTGNLVLLTDEGQWLAVLSRQ